MAKKPAIGGLARPEGFKDDIVRAGVQKVASVVRAATKTNNKYRPKTLKAVPFKVQDRIYKKSVDVESSMAGKRAVSYYKGAIKANKKNNAKKMDVALSKTRAVQGGASVRKAAQGARRRGGYR